MKRGCTGRTAVAVGIGALAGLVVGCGSQGTDAPPQASIPLAGNAQLATVAQSDKRIGQPQLVAEFPNPMPTGVTVSQAGRVFICIPRWADPTPFTVGELKQGRLVAFPDANVNRYDELHYADTFVSVQSVVVDGDDRLWVLDTGSINMGPTRPFGPKLVGIELHTNKIFQKIQFPPDVVLPTTYLNDVRFDMRRGKDGMAFITDSASRGPAGIIVVDIHSGKSWRRLSGHPSVMAEPNFVPRVEGQPLMMREPGKPAQPMKIGSDGIAISADGKTLFYTPLAAHHLYSVSVDALADPGKTEQDVEQTVQDLGDRGFASDGLESDDQNRVYLTDYENGAIRRRDPDGQYRIVVQDPRMIWPDTLSVSQDGFLYYTVNQLDRMARFHDGQDQRQPPYALFRVKIDARPVQLHLQPGNK